MLRKTLLVFGATLAFFFILFGMSLIARGLEIVRGPLPSGLGNLILYRVDLSDTFSFYLGCVFVAMALTFFWSLRTR
jgi:hypothetical protein